MSDEIRKLTERDLARAISRPQRERIARGKISSGAAGLRVEEVSDDGRRVAYVPYIAVSAPNTRHTFLLQLQYKNQEGSDSFVADLSALF